MRITQMSLLGRRSEPFLLVARLTPDYSQGSHDRYEGTCDVRSLRARRAVRGDGRVAVAILLGGRRRPAPQGRGRARFLIGARLLRAIMDISAHAI